MLVLREPPPDDVGVGPGLASVDAHTAEPPDEVGIARGRSHLIVVDEDESLVGVFSMRDLVVGLLEERRLLAKAVSTEPAESPSPRG